jgi:hypothetical protein
MIKKIVDWVIDTIVVLFLCALSIVLLTFAVIFYPFKRVRLFLAKKTTKLMDTADYFLLEEI